MRLIQCKINFKGLTVIRKFVAILFEIKLNCIKLWKKMLQNEGKKWIQNLCWFLFRLGCLQKNYATTLEITTLDIMTPSVTMKMRHCVQSNWLLSCWVSHFYCYGECHFTACCLAESHVTAETFANVVPQKIIWKYYAELSFKLTTENFHQQHGADPINLFLE